MATLQANFIVEVRGGGNMTLEMEDKISELESDIQDVIDVWNRKHVNTRMKAEIAIQTT